MSINTTVPTNINDTYAVPSLPVENISNKEDKANKGIANGYAPLDANSKVPSANLPVVDVSGQISTHNSATTSVHGIANTAELIHSTVIGPNTDKVVTFNQSGGNGNGNSEIGAWGFGVAGNNADAYIEPTGLTVEGSGKSVVVGPDKITFNGSGKIHFGGNYGGSLDLSGGTNVDPNYEIYNGDGMGAQGGSIDLRGGNGGQDGQASLGGLIQLRGANGDDGPAGSAGQIIMNGAYHEGHAGSIIANGAVNHSAGSLNMSAFSNNYGVGGAGGSINTSGGASGSGGSINLSAGANEDGNNGGSIIATAGEGGGASGGTLNMSGGSEDNSFGGSINTSNGGGSINTSNGGGYINTSGGLEGSGGSINTSTGEGGFGGSINTSSSGGSINTSVFGGSLSLNQYGGNITSHGVDADKRGGSITLNSTDLSVPWRESGSINLSASPYGDGGSIISTGGGDDIGGNIAGGTLNMSGGGNGAGGSINTSNGGGSINTNTGVIELGSGDHRAVLKSMASDATIEIKDQSGKMLVASSNGVSSTENCYDINENNRNGVRGTVEDQLLNNKGQIVTTEGGNIFTYGNNISQFTLIFSSADSMSGTYVWDGYFYRQKTNGGNASAEFENGYLVFYREIGGDRVFITDLETIDDPSSWQRGSSYPDIARPSDITITYGNSQYGPFNITPPSGGSIDTSAGGGSIVTRGGGGSIYTYATGSIELGATGTRTTLYGSASGSDKTITLPNATGTIALTSHTHGNLTSDGKVLVPYGGILSASGVDAGSFSNGTFPMIQGSGTGGVITILNGVISITSAGTGYVDGLATKAGGSRFNLVTQATLPASANLPVITTTGGNISAGSFGTTANTFCQGDDPRLSNSRTPTAHNHAISDVTNLQTTLNAKRVYSYTTDYFVQNYNIPASQNTEREYALIVNTTLSSYTLNIPQSGNSVGDIITITNLAQSIAPITVKEIPASGATGSDPVIAEVKVGTTRSWVRLNTGSNAGGWRELNTASHTHSISDVTNLQTSLDDKVFTITTSFASWAIGTSGSDSGYFGDIEATGTSSLIAGRAFVIPFNAKLVGATASIYNNTAANSYALPTSSTFLIKLFSKTTDGASTGTEITNTNNWSPSSVMPYQSIGTNYRAFKSNPIQLYSSSVYSMRIDVSGLGANGTSGTSIRGKVVLYLQ